MLTSLCVRASVRSQMRLNEHGHTHTLTSAIIPNSHGYSVLQLETNTAMLLSSVCFVMLSQTVQLQHWLPVDLSFASPLPLSFTPLFFPSPLTRSVSLCLCHDESRRGSDRHRFATRLLPQISVSVLPSAPVPSFVPSLFSEQQLP